MGRRHYKRQPLEVPVTVTGIDTNGNPFSQTAATVDVSAKGLRVRNLACLRGHRGESVLVRHKRHAAKYRVLWIGEPGGPWHDVVGIEALEDALPLFREYLPNNFDTSYVGGDPFRPPVETSDITPAVITPEPLPATARTERRRHLRYACTGTVRLREWNHEVWVDARVNEISMGGCYVETMSPFRLGTALEVELEIAEQKVLLEGVVRNAQPNAGMGIEFTRIQPREAEKLYRVIARVAPALPEKATSAGPKQEVMSLIEGITLERAITTWFGLHDVLTRQDFLKLREETERLSNEEPSPAKTPTDQSEPSQRQATSDSAVIRFERHQRSVR